MVTIDGADLDRLVAADTLGLLRRSVSLPHMRWVVLVALFLFGVAPANAHTSEQAFVLLLPTDLYIAAGVSAVALTILVVALLPHGAANLVFASLTVASLSVPKLKTLTSLGSLVFLAFLIVIGLTGTANPLENLLPLVIWTLWWMGFVALQALLGDLWSWINPWTGLYNLLPSFVRNTRPLTLPSWVGQWPGVVLFLMFACFMLADIAPEDPRRLAAFVAVYWLFTFACMLLFGAEVWLRRGECFTMLLDRFASLALFQLRSGQLHFGVPGWRITRAGPASWAGAVLVLALLGTGSFDGLNETFWWLARIGINPLEFPGRSAVVWPTVIGLLAANALLVVVFAVTIWLGIRLAQSDVTFASAFCLLALSVLPIALGYHVAHYLTAFMVQIQYAAIAINDPLGTGLDLFGLSGTYVTTGFFNTRQTVEIIWLSQAGAVVLGHVLSVLLGHALATRLFSSPRQAVLSQLPLALFMILYTLFGLWLLATPRGA